MSIEARIEKYRKQVSYSKGVRKVRALAALAEALTGRDLREATELAAEARNLARKLLGRLEEGDRRIAKYELALARALFVYASCLMAAIDIRQAEEQLLQALQIWERHESWSDMVPAWLMQAQIGHDLGDKATAVIKIDRALEVCEQLRLRHYLSGLHAQAAALYSYSDNPDAARHSIHLALSNLEHAKSEVRPSVLASISNVQRELRDMDSALQTQIQAVDAARHLDDKHLLLRLLYNLSSNIYHTDPHADYASPLLEAIVLARETGNKPHEALLHEMYGVRSMRNGLYDRAISELSQARDMYHQLENLPDLMRPLAWLGLVYAELGAPELGENFLGEAAGLVSRLPFAQGSGAVYRVILDYAPHCLDIPREIERLRQVRNESPAEYIELLIILSLLLGTALEINRDIDAARTEYLLAGEMLEKCRRPCLDANTKRSLAHIEAERGQLARSRELLQAALESSDSCHEWQTTRKVYAELASVSERLGEYEEALHYRKTLHAREREISLTQANKGVDQLLVGETEEQLQRQWREKTARAEALEKQAEHVRQAQMLDRHQTEEAAIHFQRLRKRIEDELSRGEPLSTLTIKDLLAETAGLQSADDLPAKETTAESDSSARDAVQQRFPQLTATEVRVCTAIIQGLGNRKIAEHMHVSPRAIETYRYRIRKKLGLEKGQNLTEVLMQLHDHP